MDENKKYIEKNAPPEWANRFLEWYCDPDLLDEIQGDLIEVFYYRANTKGAKKAKYLFIIEVLLFFRPSSFKKKIYLSNFQSMPGLLQNYLKISWRNTLKNKVFSFVNVFGLSVGLAACFLIMQYVSFELSYDKFHDNSNNIYRIHIDNMATNHPGAGPALKADFPEVIEFARMVPQTIFAGNIISITYEDSAGNKTVFNEEKAYDVDPSFLSMFSFPFIFGDPSTALNDISSIVISESIAEKFFDDKNPLGKTLVIDGFRSFTVTGVFKNIPENSHVKFNVLISAFMRSFGQGNWNSDWDWRWPEFYTYIQLAQSASEKQFEEKLPNFTNNYLGEIMKEINKEFHFYMQPLTDIQLNSLYLTKEQQVRSNKQTVYFLSLIALLILVIAWINYINLSTSKSVERAQEVGLRKVIGASKKQLVFQFLFESTIVNLLSIIMAMGFVILAMPYFNELTGKNIGNNFSEFILIKEPKFWMIIVGIFIIGSFFSGLYPAFILSSFKEAIVLKGKFYRSKSGIALRKVLVGFQFTISVALITGTLLVFKQVDFMRKQNLGYAQDQLLIVQSPRVRDSTIYERLETYQTALSENPTINSFAASKNIPGEEISQLNEMRNINETTAANKMVYHFYTDKNFIKTYGLSLIAGRNFSDNDKLYPLDNRIEPIPVIMNNKAIKLLGYNNPKDAINQLIYFKLGPSDRKGEIVGVLNNYHQRSLKNEYDPLIYFPRPKYLGEYFSINLKMQNLPETISFIEKEYKEKFPGNKFEYFFLNDYFNQQYAADQQFGKVFSFFSSLAIIVAALGLFGLSTFMITQRTKEIAVRKVLGAKIKGMIYLFSKDFVVLILLTNVITLPLVYLAARAWLNNFAFQVNLGWLIFVTPAVILLIISLATVSFQTIKTSSTKPIKHLRTE